MNSSVAITCWRHVSNHIITMTTFSLLLTDDSAFEDPGCVPLDWGSSGQSDSWDDRTPSIAKDLGLPLSGLCMDISFDVSEIPDICAILANIQENAYDICSLNALTDIETGSPDVMDTQPVSPSLSFFDDPDDLNPQVPSSCLQGAYEMKNSIAALVPLANNDSRCDSGYLSQVSPGDFEFPDRVEHCYHPTTNTTSASFKGQGENLLAAACIVTDIPHMIHSITPTQPQTVPSTTTKVTNKKPGEPYIEMIVKTLLSAPDKKMILADIYDHIMTRFPYYCTAPKSWRNAVRHCLSVNGFFVKRGRATNGSGFYWGLHPACISTFQKGDFRRREARMMARQSEKTRRELVSHVSPVSRFQAINSYGAPLMTSTPTGSHYRTGLNTGSSSGQPSVDMYQSYFASVTTSSLSRCWATLILVLIWNQITWVLIEIQSKNTFL